LRQLWSKWSDEDEEAFADRASDDTQQWADVWRLNYRTAGQVVAATDVDIDQLLALPAEHKEVLWHAALDDNVVRAAVNAHVMRVTDDRQRPHRQFAQFASVVCSDATDDLQDEVIDSEVDAVRQGACLNAIIKTLN